MARKEKLFAPETIKMMRDKSVRFVLVYIDEAHSTAWPIGQDYEPTPQSSLEERVSRAQDFLSILLLEQEEKEKEGEDKSGELKSALADGIITILVDNWNNDFANTFQAWPDVYY